MPDPPFDTRQESMKYPPFGTSSIEGALPFGPSGGAPSRYEGAPSRSASDSDDKGKAADVPEATPMHEPDARSNLRNQEPRLFGDTPEQAISSGLGYYEIMRLMGLPEEPQHDADPHQIQGPEDLLMLSTSIVTFQVPGFSMGLAGEIVPFAEEQSVEDPDDVGLENFDIFRNP